MTATVTRLIPENETIKSLPPNSGLDCVNCMERGHTCPATHTISGSPWCIGCLDDVPCEFQKRNGNHLDRVSPAAAAANRGGAAQASLKPAGSRAALPKPIRLKPMPVPRAKEVPVNAAPVNANGHAPAVNGKAAEAPRQCSVEPCDNKLRRDNKSGICTSCAHSGKARKKAAAAPEFESPAEFARSFMSTEVDTPAEMSTKIDTPAEFARPLVPGPTSHFLREIVSSEKVTVLDSMYHRLEILSENGWNFSIRNTDFVSSMKADAAEVKILRLTRPELEALNGRIAQMLRDVPAQRHA